MIKTGGTNTFTMLWMILKSICVFIFSVIMFPLKALNVVFSLIWLPFYVISQALSILTNVIYLICLIFLLQKLFGFQLPITFTGLVTEIFHWFFPGFVLMPTPTATAAQSNILAGQPVDLQQVLNLLRSQQT